MQIGQYIASHGGVVTAEELAPYLDVETTESTAVSSCLIQSSSAGIAILLFF